MNYIDLVCDECKYINHPKDEMIWFNFKNRKICEMCFKGSIVNSLSDLILIPQNEKTKVEFNELDNLINEWAFYSRYYTNLCDFCYIINKSVNIAIGCIGDHDSMINICTYCKDNFNTQIDKMFNLNKIAIIIPQSNIKFTKKMLLDMKETYTESEPYLADCNNVERSRLVPVGLNFNTTKKIFTENERLSDSTDEVVKIKEWVLITDGFDDGWYHGECDQVLAFNCSKIRFGELCIISSEDTGLYYILLGHYSDYVKCMIEHTLLKN